MSLSSAALTTVAKVQAIVGSGVATSRVESVIEAVSEDIANYTGRILHQAATVTEFHKGNGQESLYLRRRAITAVASVYIGDTLQTVASMDSVTPGSLAAETVYRTTENDEHGILTRLGGWPIACGVWGDLTGQPNLSSRGLNIRVVYTGGYVTPNQGGTRSLPWTIEEAAIGEAAYRISGPLRGLTSERTPGGWAQTWSPGKSSQGKLSQHSEDALDSYRLWTL